MTLNDYIIWCFSKPKIVLKPHFRVSWLVFWLFVAITVLFVGISRAETSGWTDNQIANAIYKAEGGARTSHPYGILAHYKKTTPRQACINTIHNQRIRHAKHNCGKDFLTCLRNRYCPLNTLNDPTGLNYNWLRNVKSILEGGC